MIPGALAPNRGVRGTRTGFRAHHVYPALLLMAVALSVTGCTHPAATEPATAASTIPVAAAAAAADPNAAASAVISSLGAVPIPTAPAADSTPTATPGHPQLLAIGAPVAAQLPGGVTAVVTALGPDQINVAPATGGKPSETTIGVITITALVTHGSLTLSAAQFISRDQTGHLITLTPRGPGSTTAAQGHTVTLDVQGRFASGAAQITWAPQRSVLALWDFNIELD